jgi:hypothetical protein
MRNAGVTMVYSSHITPAKRGEEKLQIPPLRYPGFLSSLVALANFMRLSLKKAAHAAIVGAR